MQVPSLRNGARRSCEPGASEVEKAGCISNLCGRGRGILRGMRFRPTLSIRTARHPERKSRDLLFKPGIEGIEDSRLKHDFELDGNNGLLNVLSRFSQGSFRNIRNEARQTLADHFPKIIEAEQENFKNSLKFLGSTALLVSDIDDLYTALGATLKPQAGAPDEALFAFHSTARIATICQRQATMAALTLLRGHRSDALIHLRRAIDAAASIWRINRHHDLAKVWLDAGTDPPGGADKTKYKAYLKQFGARDLYPEVGHPDHNPHLRRLYERYAMSSKVMHVSIFGVAAQMGTTKGEGHGVAWNFLDLSSGKDMVTALFTIVQAHLDILTVLGEAMDGRGPERDPWQQRLKDIAEREERHRITWMSRNREIGGNR